MPHATMPPTGFQALILCGPGASLNPFNTNPRDFPKALVPVANRPMVWYPLDWCHRMGITDITLIVPPESLAALDAQLAVNPYLTSLPSPKPTLLAPAGLTLTTGTAQIFRLDEVQAAITSDFLVLPCDIVTDLPGSALLDTWMTLQAGLGDAAADAKANLGGERSGRRGALGVWYETRDGDGGVGVKKEETDFLATTALPAAAGRSTHEIRNVVTAMPTDALRDLLDEQKALRVRHQLLRKHGRVRLQTSLRDAHVYLLPLWAKQLMALNETFESMGEDVVGWWSKATWQDGLAAKIHLPDSLRQRRRKSEVGGGGGGGGGEDQVDLVALNSTHRPARPLLSPTATGGFASRVGVDDSVSSLPAASSSSSSSSSSSPQRIPPVLAYIHPAPTALPTEPPKTPTQTPHPLPPATHTPLLRRTDTIPLLLSVSLYLARLPSTADHTAATTTDTSHPPTPLSHAHKIHPTSTIPSHSTIDQKTSLIDANCTLQPRITLRECVIGANVSIASGSRLQRCVVMSDVVIDEKVVLTGCVVGRRARIGRGSELRDCQVQEGYAIGEGTTSKGEVFAGFGEGGSDGDELEDDDGDDDDQGDGMVLG